MEFEKTLNRKERRRRSISVVCEKDLKKKRKKKVSLGGMLKDLEKEEEGLSRWYVKRL